MSFLGKEWLGVTGLGPSACKIPSCFQSRSAELAPALEPYLPRQFPDSSEWRRRLGLTERALTVADRPYFHSGYGGGPDRCVVKVVDQPYSLSSYGGGLDRGWVKVPGSTPGKIPNPSFDLGKMTKSVVRYEEDATDPTAIWRVVHLRPPEEPRGLPDRVPPAEMKNEKTRRTEDLWQIKLNSTQGVQLKSTPEGNFDFPSNGSSVVVKGWEKDPLPHAFTASPTLNNLNPSYGPEMAKDMEKGVSDVAKKHAQKDIVGQNMNPTAAARGKLLNEAIVHKKEIPHEPVLPGVCKYCRGKWVLGHKCKHYQQVNLMAGVSEEVVPEQGERFNHPMTIPYPFTHNLPKDIMPVDFDWSIDDKHTFIEEVVLNTLCKQDRQFTGSGDIHMVYPLKPVIDEMQKSDLAQLYVVGRADKRFRCTGLFWKLPPWPDFCAMSGDSFAQHCGYEEIESFYSVKQNNYSVLDYTVKFEELIKIWSIVNEDYYARVEGWEITSNLSKAAGLATMATMRPDLDNIDEYVWNTSVRAFSMVASVLGISALLPLLKAIDFIIPLMDALYASYYTKEVMPTLIREFQSPDEGMKKIVFKVVKQYVSTEGVEVDYIRNDIPPEFFRHFWVGVADIVGRIVEDLKDESEPYRRLVMEIIEKVVANLGTSDIDARLEELLIDGIPYAFPEQTKWYLTKWDETNPYGKYIYGWLAKEEDVKASGPIYWRLHLLLSSLLGEEGFPHSVPGMKKESFITIVSIFRSVKCSQDVVDLNKTKTLHALCDLGILIVKRLCQDHLNVSETQMVPLPTQLYAPVQNDQNEDSVESDEQMWLEGENVLAHFEARMKAEDAEVESTEDIVKGFIMLLESAEDTALKILDASDVLGLFLAVAKRSVESAQLKKIRIIMIPLCQVLSSNRNITLSSSCLSTWHYLLYKLGDSINHLSILEAVFVLVLKIIFSTGLDNANQPLWSVCVNLFHDFISVKVRHMASPREYWCAPLNHNLLPQSCMRLKALLDVQYIKWLSWDVTSFDFQLEILGSIVNPELLQYMTYEMTLIVMICITKVCQFIKKVFLDFEGKQNSDSGAVLVHFSLQFMKVTAEELDHSLLASGKYEICLDIEHIKEMQYAECSPKIPYPEIKPLSDIEMGSPAVCMTAVSLPMVAPFTGELNMDLRCLYFQKPLLEFGTLGAQFFERVRLSGIPRVYLQYYANQICVRINVSQTMPEKFHWKVDICLYGNVSKGFCQCEMGEWQVLQNGMWNAVKPPYGSKYVDVKLADKTSTSFNFSTQEEFQKWRLACLGIGFVLLFLSPIVSKWAPFLYNSFMALGVLLVVLIVLFQGMKLFPMGRKGLFYLTIYGSGLGVGSYAVHYFSTLVTSILEDFGLSEEMHNPASIFLLVVIVLTGSNGASVEDAAVIEDLLTKLETRVYPAVIYIGDLVVNPMDQFAA